MFSRKSSEPYSDNGMKSTGLKYLGLLAVISAVLSCGKEDGDIIPKGKMAEIYADMFMADQWLIQNPKATRTADTTLVYEAIFREYGYDSDDYRATVAHYMEDPDRFARILRRTVTILDARVEEDKAEQRKRKEESASRRENSFRFDFDKVWIFENGFPRVVPRDSLDYFTGRQEYFILDLGPFAEQLGEAAGKTEDNE